MVIHMVKNDQDFACSDLDAAGDNTMKKSECFFQIRNCHNHFKLHQQFCRTFKFYHFFIHARIKKYSTTV